MTTLADSGTGGLTLRQAIAQANADPGGFDTITFDPSLQGTITLTQGELLITQTTMITGPGANKITIDGNHASRIFDINNNGGNNPNQVTITGLTITNGSINGVGGAIQNLNQLVLANDTISGSTSTQNGGGIFNSGVLTSNNDTISGNTASSGSGGGISNLGTMTLIGDIISSNSALFAGGGIDNEATMMVVNDTITKNTTPGVGGGIVNDGPSLAFANDTISGNSAQQGGGVYNQSLVNAINTIISGNTAGLNGTDVGGSVISATQSLVGGDVTKILVTDINGKPILANNGGPTSTIALAVNSPAIEAGGSLAKLNGAIDALTNSITVDVGTFIAVGETLRIDSELMTVTGVNGTIISVQRGINATTHSDQAGVFLASDQRDLPRKAISDIGAYEAQLPTSVSVTISGGTYRGTAYTVTGASVVGNNSQTIASFGDPSLSYAFYAGTLTASQIATATPLAGPPKDVGDYTVVADFTSNIVGYVSASSAPAYYSITSAPLTITAVTNTRAYDGTTSAAAVPTISGLKGTDSVTGRIETYASKDVLGVNGSTLNVTGFTINDGDNGNDYTVTLKTATGTITTAALTITAATNTKVYDRTTSASAVPTISGQKGSDTVTGLVETYASKNVLGTNNSTLNVTGFTINDGNSGNDYTVTLKTGKGTITPAALTISATTNTKVYNATTTASAVPTVVSGLINGDTVTGLVEAYVSKNVLGTNGSTLNVTGSSINDGNSGGNYAVTLQTATGTITPAALTISATTNTKVYNGTTAASAIPTVASGLFSGDNVTGLVEAYASKNVLGTNGSTLNVTGFTINDGNSGNDYAVTLNTAAGTVTPAALSISASTNTKPYDGTTVATTVPTAVSGLFSGDTVTGLVEAYASKNVLGISGSTLNVTGYTINDGNNGNDYAVTLHTATGTISAIALTISATTNTKLYDGSTSAAAAPTVIGLKSIDTITGLTEAYASKNVLGANGSTLNAVGYTINDGNSGHDYVVTLHSATGTITPASLTISATSGTKTYDGTTSETVAPTISALQGADTVSGLVETFASKNVLGTNGSTLNVTGYTINDGNSGQDYLVTLRSATGTITPAALTITAASNTKAYNGTTSASAVPTAGALKGADTITGLAEAYASKNVLGTNGSTLNVSQYAINDGNGGSDYAVTLKSATGTITPFGLTISAISNTKVYDGTTSTSAVPTVVSGLITGDAVTGMVEGYSNKNVSGTNGSTLSVTGYTIADGNNGGNYTVTLQTALGTITPSQLVIAAATNTKTFDGTTSASAIPIIVSGLAGGDVVSGRTEQYASKNVLGTNGSTLLVSGYTVVDGNGGNDYVVTLQTATGTITPAALTISATSNTKVYDGTTSASAVPAVVSGLITGDTVTGLVERYAINDAIGTNGSTLLVTGYTIADGNNGSNYAVTLRTAHGTITPTQLVISAVTNTKVYDGTTSASAVPIIVSGLATGDVVTGRAEKYVINDVLGTNGSTLMVSGYTIIDGNHGGNYVVTLKTATGTITPTNLTISATNNTKVYDGTTSATAVPTVVSGLVTGDTVTGLTERYAINDAIGINGSTLLVTGYTIADGNHGGNYVVKLQAVHGTILPTQLVISAVANTKVFDGTTSASAVPIVVSGLAVGDVVTGRTEQYVSKNVLGANGSTLMVSGYTIIDGNHGGNYIVTLKTATGTITPATLTISATTNTKVYDGTTSASAVPTVVSGLVTGDTVTGLTERYAINDVLGTNGSTLLVTGYTIADGNNGGNYAVTLRTAHGTITPAQLVISAVTNTKVYDGTTTASGVPIIVSGLVTGDVVTGRTEQYASKNVLGANGSTLMVTGYTIIDGNHGGNYIVTLQTATGTITPAALTISATTNTKAFDNTTSATAIPTVAGLKGTDTVTGLLEAYTSANRLGTGLSTLQVTGFTINDGDSGGDYAITLKTATGTIS